MINFKHNRQNTMSLKLLKKYSKKTIPSALLLHIENAQEYKVKYSSPLKLNILSSLTN